MVCPNCGEQLPESARFCGVCGSVLAESVNMDAAEEVTVSGYEEGLNAAERTAAPDSADEPVQSNVTATSEYEGESVPTEEVRAQEADDLPAGSAQNSPDPDTPPSQTGQPAMGKSGKNNVLPILLIAVIVIVIVVVNVVIAMMPTAEERWQEQYDLGQQYLLELDYEQAIVAFTAAIEIDENNAEAYVARAEAYLGGDVKSASEENLHLALADYDAAIMLDDANADVYESRGDVHRTIGTEENLAAALADYDSALALDDTRVNLYLAEAGIYILLDDHVGAAQAYTGAIEGGIRTAETYLGRADAYYALGMEDIGEDEAESELEDLTDAERSYLTDALEDYEAALELGDDSEDTYIHAAVICVIMGDYDHAAEILAEGEETHPDSETIPDMAEKVAALIEERERQALIAEQRQTIEDNYLDMLLSLAQTFYEDPESMGYSDLVGDEFREFMGDLEETQFWEQENGLVLGVSLYGYIYYGEMEDGQRKGYGIWFHCGSDDISEMEASNSRVVNTIFAGEWDADYPNGPGNLYNFDKGWSYQMEEFTSFHDWEMTFINGLGDGTGTYYYSSSNDSFPSGSTLVTAENGEWVPIGEYEDGSTYYAEIENMTFGMTIIRIYGAYVTEE